MILVVGRPDAEVEALERVCRERGAEVFVLAPDTPIEVEISGAEAEWRIGQLPPIVASQANPAPWPFISVYVRNLAAAATHPVDSDFWTRETVRRSSFYANEATSLRLSLLHEIEAAGVPMYNSVRAETAELKVARLLRLARSGFPIPSTLVTQDGTRVRQFANRHAEAIYKPVGGGASAYPLVAADLQPERLAKLATAPVCFQDRIPGYDARVYLVNGELAGGVKIFSEAETDYRRAAVRYEVFDPEPPVRARLGEAARLLELRFTAIDLRIRPDGDWTILELNNFPMWTHVDRFLGQRVSTCLAAALTRG